jgi:predicted lactoylglutathione lyase
MEMRQTQPVAAARIGSINVVVEDVQALAAFLEGLGVDLQPLAPEWADWAAHHRTSDVDGSSFDVDLDSPAFANWWGGVPSELVPGVVVNVQVDSRDEVDRLHQRAIELGARELRAPWDAFWGARFSVVLAPGSLCVGLMSPMEDSHRTPGPSIGDFA